MVIYTDEDIQSERTVLDLSKKKRVGRNTAMPGQLDQELIYTSFTLYSLRLVTNKLNCVASKTVLELLSFN
jgi:hypothetical protein